MKSTDKIKRDVLLEIDKIEKRMIELSDLIHDNPEISYEEYKASKWLIEELKKYGFTIERGIAGLKTAFKADFQIGGKKPVICFMVEYDALPGIGHACGHNFSGTASIAASIAVKNVMKKYNIDGVVIALGTPGEELYSGKVPILEAGHFKGVDAAMMVHAFDRNVVHAPFLALDGLDFIFKGKSVHAAGAPHEGINALNAALITFRGIDALRQHVRDDVRIHGIITEGGEAPNIVPEKASIRFYVRAADRLYLNKVTEKVKNCARGAALMTGAKLEISNFEPKVDNLISNPTLSEIFEKNWKGMFGDIKKTIEKPLGSTDVGNVSHVVPTIHPMISIAPEGTILHTKELAEAAGSEKAHEALIKAAKTLAATAIDVLTFPEVKERIRKDFRKIRKIHSVK